MTREVTGEQQNALLCHCWRCGYEWTKRVPNRPKSCPDCKQRNWYAEYVVLRPRALTQYELDLSAKITPFLRGLRWMLNEDILEFLKLPSEMNNMQRIGRIMKHLGWIRKLRRDGDVYRWGYSPTKPIDQPLPTSGYWPDRRFL